MPTRSHHGSNKAIQPFVPVGSGERTALYSHQELRALASVDPRNELDELSEPGRFKKDLEDSKTRPRRGGKLLLGFLAGAAVGGVIAALATPKTGQELRDDLENLARRAKLGAEGLPDRDSGAAYESEGDHEGSSPSKGGP